MDGKELGHSCWASDDNTFALISAVASRSEDWAAAAVVKVLSASNTPSGITFEVGGGEQLAILSVVHNGTFELIAQRMGGNTAVVALERLDVDAYNMFQIWYDPTGPVVGVYIDGHSANTITLSNLSLSRVLGSSNNSSATGVARWREVRFETGFAIDAPLPGDFNGDGRVDAADYVFLRTYDGSPASDQQWWTYFSRSLAAGTNGSSTSSAADPEPATSSVAVLLAVAGCLRWRTPRTSTHARRKYPRNATHIL